MLNASAISALLIMERHVRKADLRALRDPQVRDDVEARLARVGMTLIADPLAPDYSIRPLPDVRIQLEETRTGVTLDSAEHTAVVLCWARLIWPQQDQPHEGAPKEYDFTEGAFAHEFKDIFGTETNAKRVLTRLHGLGFLAKHPDRDSYVAGPTLWSSIDHDKMREFVRERSILVHARERALAFRDTRAPSLAARDKMIHAFLKGAGPSYLRDIYTELGLDAKETRESLDRLRERRIVENIDPDKRKYSQWRIVE